jgi:hypothetical protein
MAWLTRMQGGYPTPASSLKLHTATIVDYLGINP